MGIIESYVSPVRMEEAMDIMGRNAFTIDDAINAFKISPSQHHVAALNYVPYTENTLTECKDTHDLIAILPISIMKIRDVANHEWPGQFSPPSSGTGTNPSLQKTAKQSGNS